MTHIMIGDPDVAAIDVEIEEPRDPQWIFGRFRILAGGESLGDWDDVVTLKAVVAWWNTFASTEVDRWDEQLEGLSGAEIFGLLRDTIFAGEYTESGGDAFRRYLINHLGMSAFDPYVVLLVEPPGRDQWLLWCREDRTDHVHEARLPAGTLQALGAQFVDTFETTQQQDASP